jgi:hypothetical protein
MGRAWRGMAGQITQQRTVSTGRLPGTGILDAFGASQGQPLS